MKYSCPSCGGTGISALAKRWSARECPAKCSLCSGLSHVLASSSSGIFVGGVLVFIVAFVAALVIGSSTTLAAGAAFVVAALFNIWAWRNAEMFPISREKARIAARVGWFVGVVSIVLGILN